MILKDGQKWACRSCITGHRSSRCTHADRELFPIAKKGRPSSHCKVCREAGIPSSSNEPPPPGCTCQAKRKARASIPSAPGSISPDDVLPNGPSGTKGSGRVRDKRRKESQDSLNSQGAQSFSGTSDTSRQSSPGQSHLNPLYSQLQNGSTAGQIPPSLPPPHPPPQSMAEQHLYHYQHHPQQQQYHSLPPLSQYSGSVPGYAGAAGIPQDGYSANSDTPWWSQHPAGYTSQHQLPMHDRRQHDDLSGAYPRYSHPDDAQYLAADGQHRHHPAGLPWPEQQHLPQGEFLPFPQQGEGHHYQADQSNLSHNALNYRSSYYPHHPDGDNSYQHSQPADMHTAQYHHEPLPGDVPQPSAHAAGSAPWPSSSSFDGYYASQPTVKPRDYGLATSHNAITITPPNGLAAARTDSSESVLDVKPDISAYQDAAAGEPRYDDHYRRQDQLQALHQHHSAPEQSIASGGYMQPAPLENGIVNMTGDTGTYQGPGGSGPGTPFMQLRIPDHKRKFSQ